MLILFFVEFTSNFLISVETASHTPSIIFFTPVIFFCTWPNKKSKHLFKTTFQVYLVIYELTMNPAAIWKMEISNSSSASFLIFSKLSTRNVEINLMKQWHEVSTNSLVTEFVNAAVPLKQEYTQQNTIGWCFDKIPLFGDQMEIILNRSNKTEYMLLTRDFRRFRTCSKKINKSFTRVWQMNT